MLKPANVNEGVGESWQAYDGPDLAPFQRGFFGTTLTLYRTAGADSPKAVDLFRRNVRRASYPVLRRWSATS